MIDFPASPSIGQTFTSGNQSWTWDGIAWSLTGSDDEPGFLPRTGGTMTGLLQALAGVEVVGPFTAQGGTFTQPLSVGEATGGSHATTLSYVNGKLGDRYTKAEADARYLRLTGGALSGPLTMAGQLTITNAGATVASISAVGAMFLAGHLTLNAGDPTQDAHAARKAYVDAQIAAAPYVGLSGNDTIAGAKTFTGSPTVTPNLRMSMPYAGGATKELQYTGSVLGFYDRTNLRWDLQIDANGNLTPRGYMDASNLSGTINAARLPSNALLANTDINVQRVSIDPQSGSGAELWLRRSDGTNTGALFTPSAASDLLYLRSYNAAGSSYKQISLNGATGELVAPSFSGDHKGDGSGLTGLPAASLTGTISNSRMSGNYSFSNLDLTGRLLVTGSDSWGSLAGLRIDGSSPNIYFRQTDATANAMIGVNTSSFYVLGDTDGDGVYDRTALELKLDGSELRVGGALLAEAGTSISAGNGLTGGGNLTTSRSLALGTPSSITSTSTNSVTSTSHTHSLGAAAVRELMAEHTAGQVGTYGMLEHQGSATMEPNATTAGSNLRWSTADGRPGDTPSGTWRLMGRIETGSGGANNVSLWLRIS